MNAYVNIFMKSYMSIPWYYMMIMLYIIMLFIWLVYVYLNLPFWYNWKFSSVYFERFIHVIILDWLHESMIKYTLKMKFKKITLLIYIFTKYWLQRHTHTYTQAILNKTNAHSLVLVAC